MTLRGDRQVAVLEAQLFWKERANTGEVGASCGRVALLARNDSRAPLKRLRSVSASQDTTVAAPPAQVPTSLIGALEYDLTVRDSDTDGSPEEAETTKHEGTTGNTSCQTLKVRGAFQRPRRLWLIWNSGVNQEWHRDARGEMWPREPAWSLSGGAIPGVIRRQRWSPSQCSLDVGSSRQNLSSPVLDWLVHCLSGSAQVSFHDGVMDADEAVRTGWCSLRDVFRLWNIFDRGDLTIWLQGQGFAATQPGNHIPARTQEFVLSSACRVAARVALLEVVYVPVVLHTTPNR